MNEWKNECLNAWINERVPANIFYEADLESVYSSSPSLTGVKPKDIKNKGNVSEYM